MCRVRISGMIKEFESWESEKLMIKVVFDDESCIYGQKPKNQ